MGFEFDDIVEDIAVETLEVDPHKKFRPKKYDFVIYVTYPTIYTDLKRYNRLYKVVSELSKMSYADEFYVIPDDSEITFISPKTTKRIHNYGGRLDICAIYKRIYLTFDGSTSHFFHIMAAFARLYEYNNTSMTSVKSIFCAQKKCLYSKEMLGIAIWLGNYSSIFSYSIWNIYNRNEFYYNLMKMNSKFKGRLLNKLPFEEYPEQTNPPTAEQMKLFEPYKNFYEYYNPPVLVWDDKDYLSKIVIMEDY